MELKNILSDEDKKNLQELSVMLEREKNDLVLYKDMLSNLWRVTQKTFKRNENRIKSTDDLISKIKLIVGEKT